MDGKKSLMDGKKSLMDGKKSLMDGKICELYSDWILSLDRDCWP